MKVLDRIGLTVFSVLILITSVIVCSLAFGWLSPVPLYEVIKIALNDVVTTNIMLVLSIAFILLAIKCIFFFFF